MWAAWAWVEAPDDVVMCGRILGVIAWSGPTSSLEPVLDRALEAAVASGSEQLPDILHHRAVFHRVHRSDPDAARVDAEALEALARSADTPALHGNAALTMAFASVGADEAIAHLRDAVAYLAEAQDERYLGVARARPVAPRPCARGLRGAIPAGLAAPAAGLVGNPRCGGGRRRVRPGAAAPGRGG